ncbi:MAG: MBL fold metallo-hydrolase, partial [Acidobacteriota bacterium]|nr:MBL fold metallo-hydrolase [Acidobacteriota bacterium]
MRPLNRLGWLLACLVLASCAIAQDAEEVTIGVEKVVDGVYMLTGRGGNLGLAVGDDGAFLIDDQYAPLSDKIRSAVESVSKTPLRFIVNTHWHGDHTGGNENLGSGGVTILAHDNVRQRMSVEQVMEVFDLTTPPSPTAALPVITFPDRITFHMNGLEIETLHVPAAHTDGDSMIFFKGINVIHMGDVYFNGGYPFIDAGSGGTIDGVIAAVKTVLERSDADTRIIPGHGTLSTPKELREYLA